MRVLYVNNGNYLHAFAPSIYQLGMKDHNVQMKNRKEKKKEIGLNIHPSIFSSHLSLIQVHRVQEQLV